MWLDVALDKSAAIPTDLIHTVGIAIPKPTPPLIPGAMNEKVAPVTVQTRKPAVISPPLDGPSWLDGNSCCDMTRTPDGGEPDQRTDCGRLSGSPSTTSS